MAVDYGRWLSAKSKTLNAMDTAVLAGGRVLQLPNKGSADAIAAAQKYYAQNKSNNLHLDNTNFTVTNNQIVANTASSVRTPFLSMMGIKTLPVKVRAKAVLAAGAGSHVEIAMMLDTTGSMAGQKMVDLKAAAKDLVDIVIWQDQSRFSSRVALAPFSNYINVGSTFFNDVAGPNAGKYNVTTTKEVEVSVPVTRRVCRRETIQVPVTTCRGVGNSGRGRGSGRRVCTTTTQNQRVTRCENETTIETQTQTQNVTTVFDLTSKGDKYTCIKERSNSDRYKDTVPGAGNYFDYYGDTSTEQQNILDDGSGCKPNVTITPLSNDKVLLKQRIDAMPETGGTGGHFGTQWAWYMVSPNWNAIWPAASQAKPYALLSQTNQDGSPKLHKIAVLMTDGSYNRSYSGDNSTTQARELCTNMKAAGIQVYTIGFAISQNSTPDVTMQQCASSSSHYYNASNGEALKAAFRDIALKIADLRLTE